jgi:hypothetical protein
LLDDTILLVKFVITDQQIRLGCAHVIEVAGESERAYSRLAPQDPGFLPDCSEPRQRAGSASLISKLSLQGQGLFVQHRGTFLFAPLARHVS